MIYQFIKPAAILQPFIKHYWILEEKEPIKGICKQRIYPSGFNELILYYGDRYLNIDKNNQSTLQPYFHFAGQANSYYDVCPTGRIGLITVTFKPDAAKLFFKLPISKTENSSVALEDLLGKPGYYLEEQLKLVDNNTKRIQLLEDFLVSQLKAFYTDDYKRIRYSVGKINQNKGNISVESLADYACLSTKQFNRKFSEFVGVNPKQFTKVVRFQNAIYNRQIKTTTNLTELAYYCGYYDQAHFTNEFKSFTGYTPKEFFKIGEPYSDYFS